MKKILNLTQHPATPEQMAEGVFEPKNKEQVKALLTFDELPNTHDVHLVAHFLTCIAEAEGASAALIGGAPYLMPELVCELSAVNITPLFAFSKRVSVEELQPDGSVKKTTVFKHAGFVKSCNERCREA